VTFRKLVERTIYVMKCPTCRNARHLDDHAPRESRCECGTWCKWEAQTWTGPDVFATRPVITGGHEG
jgi:hypothetical protein